MRRRVGVFGGSFDPPHLGHAMVSLWALSTCPLDEVWWIPTYRHAFGKQSAPFAQRMRWCVLAATPLASVRVDDIEAELGGESRTIDTLEALEARHSDTEFALVVGSDLVPELPRWKRWEDLQRYPIYAVGRGESDVGVTTDVRIPDVSSTALRAALRAGDHALAEAWMHRDVLDDVVRSGVFRAAAPASAPFRRGEDGGDRGE